MRDCVWLIDRAIGKLTDDLKTAIDRLVYTDPESSLYSYERGHISALRSALINLGVNPLDLPDTPHHPRELLRQKNITETFTSIEDSYT